MTTRTDATTVREILETVLAIPLDGIENPTRLEIDGWDSLTHIEVMFMLEDAFDVRFSEDEIAKLDSLAAIVALVGDRT